MSDKEEIQEKEEDCNSLSTPINKDSIMYSEYRDESQLKRIISLIEAHLSEPYPVYTYRYFLHGWPELSLLALHDSLIVGVIICKVSKHKNHSTNTTTTRGYIGMLAVDLKYRRLRIASTLVRKALDVMKNNGAHECVLETELDNIAALKLYQGKYAYLLFYSWIFMQVLGLLEINACLLII
jgi:N-alpha-acetyltransferase 30